MPKETVLPLEFEDADICHAYVNRHGDLTLVPNGSFAGAANLTLSELKAMVSALEQFK